MQDWQLGLLLASSGPEQMPVSAVPARQVEASVQLEHTTSPEDVEFSATYWLGWHVCTDLQLDFPA